MATRLLLLRHGESEGNAARILQGRFDSPLSDTGRAQAHLTGSALAGEGIDRIIASPLLRASETAEVVASYLELEPAHHEGLLEYDMGAASGKTWPEIRDEFAGVFEKLAEGERPTFPGEEGRRNFAGRVAATLREVASSEGTTLLVTHGGVIGAMCHLTMGMDYVTGSRFSVSNCSITELRSSPGGTLILRRTNDVCHLLGNETQLDLG